MQQGPADEVARIDIVQYGNGEIGIQGNIGDVKSALAMLDAAREAVSTQLGYRLALDKKKVVLPASMVSVPRNEQLYPVDYAGDRLHQDSTFHTGSMA